MRCDNCNTAIGYNLLMQWWYQAHDPADFHRQCPFCPATLCVRIEADISFHLTTLFPAEHPPPEPH